jgi:hypothetical protein
VRPSTAAGAVCAGLVSYTHRLQPLTPSWYVLAGGDICP